MHLQTLASLRKRLLHSSSLTVDRLGIEPEPPVGLLTVPPSVCRLRLSPGAAGLRQRVRRLAGEVLHQAGLHHQPGVSGGGGLRMHRYC